MAGKRCVFASDPVFCAMDCLSKNQLIDLVIDLCRAELGEDASDDAVIGWVTSKIGPTWRMRKDKPVDLFAKRDQRLRVLEHYKKQAVPQ